jgi:hypothetical protein
LGPDSVIRRYLPNVRLGSLCGLKSDISLRPRMPTADSCTDTAANSILTVHCWDICRRVGEAGIAKDMPNKSFGRIAELNVGPDRRRLATTDNWWETVLWLTPSIIKS